MDRATRETIRPQAGERATQPSEVCPRAKAQARRIPRLSSFAFSALCEDA